MSHCEHRATKIICTTFNDKYYIIYNSAKEKLGEYWNQYSLYIYRDILYI